MKYLKKGFTLIELIIVIAVLGILAAGLLAVLDPAQQILRATDGGTKNSAYEVARAASRYANQAATGAGQVWPTTITDMVNAGELKSAPAGVSYVVVDATHHYACFLPGSKAVKSDPNSKWTSAAVASCTAVYNSTTCYYCVQAD